MWKRNPGNKHNARRVQIDGIWFQSTGEGARYLELKLMKVPNLECHPKFPIYVNGIKVCDVYLDYTYSSDDGQVYEDWKGKDNAMSRLKRRMVEAQYGFKVLVTGPKQRARRAWMPYGKAKVKSKKVKVAI